MRRQALEIYPDHIITNYSCTRVPHTRTRTHTHTHTQVRGDYEQAEAVYRQALEMDPDHITTIYNYGGLLKNARQVTAAGQRGRGFNVFLGRRARQYRGGGRQ